jgi:hypothetical protein
MGNLQRCTSEWGESWTEREKQNEEETTCERIQETRVSQKQLEPIATQAEAKLAFADRLNL